jgi:ethanolamine utilization protein EutA (predicted chaperonin)
MNELINLPEIKDLKHSDEDAVRALTHQMTEMLKQTVFQHIKDNYKVIIQVITYPKQNEKETFIMSQCLWNYRTDDVLSLEMETDIFKFFIVIHGVVA